MDQANQQDSSSASPATRAAAFSVHIFTAMGAGIALIATAGGRARALGCDVRVARCRAADRRARWPDRAAAGCRTACSRTGRAKCSISWSISSPTSSCRPTRSPPAACCCRWRRRCSASASWSRGALYFADRRMKTADNHFRGFPGLWNGAAFYLFLLHLPPALRQPRRRHPDCPDICAFPCRASDTRGAPARAHLVVDRRSGRCLRSLRSPVISRSADR